jgi:O-acetyl-ADP-ribose deacetylase (regulator of RNase III)
MRIQDVDIILADLNADLVSAWREAFADCPRVCALNESILEVVASAIVSPANSFGFMDGGLDLVLSQHFGWHLEKRVRERLLNEFDGELPVGQAIIVPTDHPNVPWLISAPTMRVPMNVQHTAHAHLACRAILRAVRAHNADSSLEPITSLVCPGLGTGEGRMTARRCAVQMRHAYEVCVHDRPLKRGGLAAAVREHMMLIGHDDDWE